MSKIPVKTNSCRHRKLIVAHAFDVYFTPGQEPYTSGVVESCGVDAIIVGTLTIYYCPKCKAIKACEPDDVWHE